MSLEARKAAAVALLTGLGKGGPDRAAMTEDATWWSATNGERPVAEFLKTAQAMRDTLFAGGGRMEIRGITWEGERVAVEAEGFLPLKDGRTYHNTYHFLVEFRHGQVHRVKEYCDTAYARDTFGGGST